MNCYAHPDVSAVGTCVNCGKAVCADCARTVGGKIYCPECEASAVASLQAGGTNSMAVTSLILGIVSIPLLLCLPGIFPPLGCLGVLAGIVALIIGSTARNQIKQSGGVQGGGGMALAGMIIGGLTGVFFGIVVLVISILLLLGPVVGNVFSNIVENL